MSYGMYEADIFDRAGVVTYGGRWTVADARQRYGDLVQVLRAA